MFRELIEFLGILLGGFIMFILAVLLIAVPIDMWTCAKYEEATGKSTKFMGLTCYVQDKGQWYAWVEYKNRLVTKGEIK